MLASAFDEMPSPTFVKLWKKLWLEIENLVKITTSKREYINQAMLHDLQSLRSGDQMELEDVEEWISNSNEGLENKFFSDEEKI